MRDFPHVERNWKQTIQWLMTTNKWPKTQQLKDVDLAFKWWISGKSFDEFYADEVLQQKMDF